MGFPWKRIGLGLKVALGVAIKLHDAKIINVKELDKVKTVKDVIEGEVAAARAKAKPRP